MNIWKIIYLNCGEGYELIIDHRSCRHNLSSYEIKRLKNIQAWTGFEPMTSAIPVQCSTDWAIKPSGSWSLWSIINSKSSISRQSSVVLLGVNRNSKTHPCLAYRCCIISQCNRTYWISWTTSFKTGSWIAHWLQHFPFFWESTTEKTKSKLTLYHLTYDKPVVYLTCSRVSSF